MILHTLFLVDTSLSAEAIFEPLVDDVLCPLANELQKRARPDCSFPFSLYTFPTGGRQAMDTDAAGLAQALDRLELTGGAPDGRETLGPALAQLWDGLETGGGQRYALCVVSDAPAFADAAGSVVRFAAPDALTAIVLLHHPDCADRLLPMDGASPIPVTQAHYALDDSLPSMVARIVRNLSDTVLENSNLG